MSFRSHKRHKLQGLHRTLGIKGFRSLISGRRVEGLNTVGVRGLGIQKVGALEVIAELQPEAAHIEAMFVLPQRVLCTDIVECRVSILGITIMT